MRCFVPPVNAGGDGGGGAPPISIFEVTKYKVDGKVGRREGGGERGGWDRVVTLARSYFLTQSVKVGLQSAGHSTGGMLVVVIGIGLLTSHSAPVPESARYLQKDPSLQQLPRPSHVASFEMAQPSFTQSPEPPGRIHPPQRGASMYPASQVNGDGPPPPPYLKGMCA